MDRKFDVVIGNPPYQEESTGDAKHSLPVYHKFMDAAYKVGKRAVLITPARFLFNAGYTPKDWNRKMLSDPHLSVPCYVPNSDVLFPGTDIKGGIAVTYRDDEREQEAIGTFTKYTALNQVLYKVEDAEEDSVASVITSSRSYRYTDTMHADYPELMDTMAAGEQYKVNTRTLEQLSVLYHEQQPTDDHGYVQVLGLIQNRRLTRWIRRDYVTGPESFGAYKVVIPAANGSGKLGEVLSSPLVVGPKVAVTQTYITIGCFKAESEAEACLKYVKSKFARSLLGILKITQHNPAKVWKHVPLQDFTGDSDIDWTKSIPGIDRQLYAKYGLDADEIEFIESNVQPME